MRIVWSIKPAVAAQLGLTLLIVPIYFISASALRQDAPGLSLLGSPLILLGSLLVAFTLNALPILSVNLCSDTPPVPERFPLIAILEFDCDCSRLAAAGRVARICLCRELQARLGS